MSDLVGNPKDRCSNDEAHICRSKQLVSVMTSLTHISLASFVWDIGKQNSPRCDAAKCGVPSGAILFADMIFIEK